MSDKADNNESIKSTSDCVAIVFDPALNSMHSMSTCDLTVSGKIVKTPVINSTPMHPNVIHDMNVLAKYFGDGDEDDLYNVSLSAGHNNDNVVEDDSNFTVVMSKSQKYNLGKNRKLNVFDKFWDNKGMVKHTLCEDIKGLMALFEASQLSIEGEDCLEEAGEFCRKYLSAWVSRFHDHPQAKVVAHTLRFPIHRSLSRFMPTSLHLENAGEWTNSLQELYKLDTQIVRSLHLEEIIAVSKWWKSLDLARDLKFARAEPIKWYMWLMACLPDPRFSEERIELTKPVSLIYIIDDIFDCYGSIDELTLFTDAVKSWDLAAMEKLPDYMKLCFKALYDITNEFAFKTLIKHGCNPIGTLIKSWVRLFNASLEDAKWFASGHLPNTKEYLKNSIVSTGVQVFLVHIFFFMGKDITKETVTLMDGDDFPSLISTTATILRLCDDLEGNKEVNRDGNDGSYLKCYMEDHPGVSIEQTREHISHQISDAWKTLNRECLTPENPLPLSFAEVCLNTARMVLLMYNYDNNSPQKLEEYVRSLFHGGGYIQSILED